MNLRSIMTVGVPALILTANIAAADPARKEGATHHDKAMEGPTEVLRSYGEAIANKNLDEMENYVASNGEDFTIFEGSGANIGWADYRDHHLAPEFASPDITFHTYEYQNIKTHREGDMAYSTFSIKMDYTYKGENKKRTGRGTAVFKYQDGAWKIVHLQTS